jgi:hypothetical protein
MVLARQVTELTFGDIQALVDNEEPESVTLEYKREIDTSPGGKKELAKDVSAMANSQGGHLIIGLAEEDHRPKIPDHFVDRMLGKQKVEEWLEQVLNSNIQQRVDLRVRPISVPDRSAECVVVVQVPQSPRVPHMVTTDGEKRYYVRHNFQTLPAEEYEVRDMFERSQRITLEVEEYLRRQGWLDAEDKDFGANNLTRRLGRVDPELDEESRQPGPTPVISFVACPSSIQEWINTASQEVRHWLDPIRRVYYPGGPFIPRDQWQDTLEGLLYMKRFSRQTVSAGPLIARYLHVHRTGYVEHVYPDGRRLDDFVFISLILLAGRFRQFLGFVSDFYRYAKIPTTVCVMLNLANVEEANLFDFADGWRDVRGTPPRHFVRERSRYPHIQVRDEVDVLGLDDSATDSLWRQFLARVGNAFGQERSRCFNVKDGAFPIQRFQRANDSHGT